MNGRQDLFKAHARMRVVVSMRWQRGFLQLLPDQFSDEPRSITPLLTHPLVEKLQQLIRNLSHLNRMCGHRWSAPSL
jgi:hypothetical protein